ncbi:hypothetical protein N0V90_010295 [Kalmusia sp. IMI 367209]|nr:hypothetical protein N0V90_010295 [Kalmusia sp. IMI 367209]
MSSQRDSGFMREIDREIREPFNYDALAIAGRIVISSGLQDEELEALPRVNACFKVALETRAVEAALSAFCKQYPSTTYGCYYKANTQTFVTLTSIVIFYITQRRSLDTVSSQVRMRNFVAVSSKIKVIKMAYKRSVIVTGGTINMGYQAALILARQNPDWLIVISSRSDPNRSADSINKTLDQKNTIYIPLDLSDSQKVRAYAKEWASNDYPPIQALLLNAALQFPGALNLTSEGIESTFAITHVGHALLFHLLCPYLAPKARVIVTASGVHDPALRTGMPKPVYTSAEELAHPPPAIANGDGRTHYVNSKLANILWTYALQKRLDQRAADRGIIVNALDPGLMPGSGLAREYGSFMKFVWNSILPKLVPLLRIFMGGNVHTPAESGAALARLATSDDVASVKGKYYEGLKQRESSKESYEEAKQDDLWKWTVEWSAQDEEQAKKFEKFA